jgi:hypothetical protein
VIWYFWQYSLKAPSSWIHYTTVQMHPHKNVKDPAVICFSFFPNINMNETFQIHSSVCPYIFCKKRVYMRLHFMHLTYTWLLLFMCFFPVSRSFFALVYCFCFCKGLTISADVWQDITIVNNSHIQIKAKLRSASFVTI